MSAELPPCEIAVVVATLGRPAIVTELVGQLAAQQRKPDVLVISAVTADDVATCPASDAARFPIQTIFGPKGLTVQRNAGLRWLHENTALHDTANGIVVFFDDDFVPRADWLAAAARLFRTCPELVGADGIVLADGAGGTAYSQQQATDILLAGVPIVGRRNRRSRPSASVRSLYGCNMAFRAAATAGRYFDEELPLYGWLEDLDYSAQLGASGAMLRSSSMVGVHRGVNAGRTSGLRYGYSQVANPIYLMKKGTMRREVGFKRILMQFLANLVRSLRPEPNIDRFGRLVGNCRAFYDCCVGHLHPRRILEL